MLPLYRQNTAYIAKCAPVVPESLPAEVSLCRLCVAKMQPIPLNPLMASTLGLICVISGNASMVPKYSVHR